MNTKNNIANFLASFFKDGSEGGIGSLTYGQLRALINLINLEFGSAAANAVEGCFEEDCERRFQIKPGVSIGDVFLGSA